MRDKDYPNFVCKECGTAANILTCLIRYRQLPLKIAHDISTFHEGYCDVCARMTDVTEPRDFFYPDFMLMSRRFKNQLREVIPTIGKYDQTNPS